RLNTRMHCKKCDAVFHMDPSGKIMLGEPGGRAKQAERRKAAAATKDEPTDVIGLIVGNPLVRKGAVVALVAFVGYFAFQGISGVLPKGVPQNLGDRTDYVAVAFCDKHPDRIMKLAAPGTEADLSKWYDLTRPKFQFEGPQGPGNEVIRNISVVSEDEGAG